MPFRFSNEYACDNCGSVEWENRRDPVCAHCGRPLMVHDVKKPGAGDHGAADNRDKGHTRTEPPKPS